MTVVMSSRSIARAASRAWRASRDAFAPCRVSIASASLRIDDDAESARRALCTTAARDMRARARARATMGVGVSASVSCATVRSMDVARIAVREYSKKNKKKNKQQEPSPVAVDDEDDEDDEDGDDGEVVEYDAKKWQSKFESAVHAFEVDLGQLRTARASPGMIDHIMVDAYGEMTALSHLATITAPNSQTLSLTLFDPSTKPNVEKAIMNSPLGLVPKDSSDGLIVPIPAMTQDMRKEVCKLASKLGETAKIAARNIRHKAQKEIKRAGMSEDEQKRAEKSLQALTDDAVSKITQKCAAKEKEIMSL